MLEADLSVEGTAGIGRISIILFEFFWGVKSTQKYTTSHLSKEYGDSEEHRKDSPPSSKGKKSDPPDSLQVSQKTDKK